MKMIAGENYLFDTASCGFYKIKSKANLSHAFILLFLLKANLQPFTKHFKTLSPFAKVSLHHKWSKSKLLLPETECVSSLTRCQKTWDLRP